MARPNWDDYFTEIAKMIATRATCPRKSVGVVIVENKIIVSSGYNGAPSGQPHCDEVGCLLDNNSCVRARHAEINAFDQLGQEKDWGNLIVYLTLQPCAPCMEEINRRQEYGELVCESLTFKWVEDYPYKGKVFV